MQTFRCISYAMALAAVLTACQQAPEKQAESASLTMPVINTAGADRYLIDPTNSELIIRVYRDGPLAQFGHNHIIAATNISGEIYRRDKLDQSGVRLMIPVSVFAIDRPADRARAGNEFESEVSASDIAGTRANMLGEALLDASHFNNIELRSVAIHGDPPNMGFTMRIAVRGTVSEWVFPARVMENDNKITVEGVTKLSLQRLGLTPFSIMGGGLSVADQMEVHYRFVAIADELDSD